MFGVSSQIRTDGFTDLQSVAMGLSATDTQLNFRYFKTVELALYNLW